MESASRAPGRVRARRAAAWGLYLALLVGLVLAVAPQLAEAGAGYQVTDGSAVAAGATFTYDANTTGWNGLTVVGSMPCALATDLVVQVRGGRTYPSQAFAGFTLPPEEGTAVKVGGTCFYAANYTVAGQDVVQLAIVNGDTVARIPAFAVYGDLDEATVSLSGQPVGVAVSNFPATQAVDCSNCEAAAEVALGPQDRERLDYVWWGVWMTAGFLLVLLISPYYHRAFPWGRTVE